MYLVGASGSGKTFFINDFELIENLPADGTNYLLTFDDSL